MLFCYLGWSEYEAVCRVTASTSRRLPTPTCSFACLALSSQWLVQGEPGKGETDVDDN